MSHAVSALHLLLQIVSGIEARADRRRFDWTLAGRTRRQQEVRFFRDTVAHIAHHMSAVCTLDKRTRPAPDASDACYFICAR